MEAIEATLENCLRPEIKQVIFDPETGLLAHLILLVFFVALISINYFNSI